MKLVGGDEVLPLILMSIETMGCTSIEISLLEMVDWWMFLFFISIPISLIGGRWFKGTALANDVHDIPQMQQDPGHHGATWWLHSYGVAVWLAWQWEEYLGAELCQKHLGWQRDQGAVTVCFQHLAGTLKECFCRNSLVVSNSFWRRRAHDPIWRVQKISFTLSFPEEFSMGDLNYG